MAGGSGGDMAMIGGLPSAIAKKVVTGSQHTCALTTAGAVRCWGVTEHGQLGDGTISPDAVVNTPVQVIGLTTGVLDLSAAGDHTCAVTAGGGVKCWGANNSGQLGNGITTDSATPVAVMGLSSGVTAVTTGEAHSCALLSGGTVKCWGSNSDLQLGATATDASPTPVPVAGLAAGVTAIAAGTDNLGTGHTCALAGGVVQCWGNNSSGELGRTTTDFTDGVPGNVTGLSGVGGVAVGASTTCTFASSNGAASCWGRDDEGELGDGHDGVSLEQHSPVAVSGPLTGVTSLSAGFYFTCAVAGGAAKCWGDGSDGELGNGGEALQHAPVQVTGLSAGVAQIAAGTHHACAVLSSGAVTCWGLNSAGQLGDGKDGTGTGVTENNSDVPVAVLSLP